MFRLHLLKEMPDLLQQLPPQGQPIELIEFQKVLHKSRIFQISRQTEQLHLRRLCSSLGTIDLGTVGDDPCST